MRLSKRQVLLAHRMNSRLFDTLVHLGHIQLPLIIDPVASLVEGAHFVSCRECGAKIALVTAKHLQVCCGLTQEGYLKKHPGAPVLSSLSARLKVKSDDQRKAQSEKLKSRFLTSEGEATRRVISESSKRMQSSESGRRSQDNLRRLNNDPVMMEARSKDTKNRWVHSNLRSVVEGWHRTHKAESNALAARARRFILRKKTNLHLGFKRLMEENGVTGFVSEYEVGFYAIDEAHPSLGIALEIDGCYWHSCSECGLTGPKENARLDKSKTTYLTRRGWLVVRLWEHEIKQNPAGCVDRIRQMVLDREKSNAGRSNET